MVIDFEQVRIKSDNSLLRSKMDNSLLMVDHNDKFIDSISQVLCNSNSNEDSRHHSVMHKYNNSSLIMVIAYQKNIRHQLKNNNS
jgi:hypothetical protein